MVYKNLPLHSGHNPKQTKTMVADVFKSDNGCLLKAQLSSDSFVIPSTLYVWQEGRKPLCTTIVGYVSDTQTDLQSPVQFALSYSLVQVAVSKAHLFHHHLLPYLHHAEQEEPLVEYNTGKLLPLANSRPILNQQQVFFIIWMAIMMEMIMMWTMMRKNQTCYHYKSFYCQLHTVAFSGQMGTSLWISGYKINYEYWYECGE